MPKKDYSNWSKEELVRELKKVEKRKKYGIVWEDKPEQVALLCKEKLPILAEDKDKEIVTDKEKPNHILIEGDNYHALSVLNYTHKGKIDLIYIDPPYNTGKKKEWSYNDHHVDKDDSYRHSKWLAFIEKRLKLARNLLSAKGIILISIDDNELAQLKMLCNEIFGEENWLETFVWNTEGNIDNQRKIRNNHEYVLTYAKSEKLFEAPRVIDPNITEESKLYRDYIENSITKNGPKNPMSSLLLPKGFPCQIKEGIIKKDASEYPIKSNDIVVKNNKTVNEVTVKTGWSCKDLLIDFIKNQNKPILDGKGQETKFLLTSTGAIYVYKKRQQTQGHVLSVLRNFGTTKQTSNYLVKMGIKFEYPKPIELIKYLVSIHNNRNAIILDFFAGSGTTGQAVLEQNVKDGGSRRFILCTNNEDNNGSGLKIAEDICYPRLKKSFSLLENQSKNKFVQNMPGNLKYFRTDFVDAESTDKNRRKMVGKSTEMLCLKEDCFYEIKEGHNFRIFTNSQGKLLGIIYDDNGIEPFKKEVKKIKKQFVVYVFSLDESAREDEFDDIKDLVDLKPIPAVILNVYKRIFK